jgi:hypothetical protein
MSNTKHTDALQQDDLQIGALGGRLMALGGALAVGGLGASAALARTMDAKHATHAYLVAVVYFISISLGSLFFVQLQHLTRAGWSVVVRRIAELMATGLPVLLLFLLPLLVGVVQGSGALLPWADPALVHADPVLQNKAPYLNVPFLLARVAVYFSVWLFFSRFFLRGSLKQDDSGSLQHSYTMQWVAAPAMACFVLSLTFFAVDFLMSLEPKFISTMFGVYFFAGCAMSFFATTVQMARMLQGQGKLRSVINTEHYHDLGKFTFGFVFFWGYVAFSQYMLIWYANIPEETEWLLQRQTGTWMYFSLALLVGHFILPFAGLLSRHVKRNRAGLTFWTAFLLVMQWVDLYWLVMPSVSESGPPFSLMDLTCWLGMAGVFLAHFGWVAQGRRLVPVRDPRIDESLAFKNA